MASCKLQPAPHTTQQTRRVPLPGSAFRVRSTVTAWDGAVLHGNQGYILDIPAGMVAVPYQRNCFSLVDNILFVSQSQQLAHNQSPSPQKGCRQTNASASRAVRSLHRQTLRLQTPSQVNSGTWTKRKLESSSFTCVPRCWPGCNSVTPYDAATTAGSLHRKARLTASAVAAPLERGKRPPSDRDGTQRDRTPQLFCIHGFPLGLTAQKMHGKHNGQGVGTAACFTEQRREDAQLRRTSWQHFGRRGNHRFDGKIPTTTACCIHGKAVRTCTVDTWKTTGCSNAACGTVASTGHPPWQNMLDSTLCRESALHTHWQCNYIL